jgi:hypothetical protein
MARTSGSDDLFILIHSLTTEEKGNFKKFALRHNQKGSKHLQLFDAINKQVKFDEKELKKKFPAYVHMKGYLWEMILKSLFLVNLQTDNQIIERKMGYAAVLSQRSMNKHAEKLIEQSLEIAIENNLQHRALLLLGILNSMQIRTVAPDKKWEFIMERAQQETALLNGINYVSKALVEQRKVYYLIEERGTGRPYRHHIKDIDLALLENEKAAVSEHAKMIRCNTLCAYYDLTDDRQKSFAMQRQNLKLIKKIFRNQPSQSHLVQYSIALINFITSAISLGAIADARKEIGSLPSLFVKDARRGIHSMFQYVHLVLEIALMQKDYAWGIAETQKHISSPTFLLNTKQHLVVSLSIYQKLALLQLSVGDHRTAYITIQEIYELNKLIKSSRVNADCLLLNILLQFEMNNYDLLPALLGSAKRTCQSYKDKSFLAAINLLSKCNNKQQFLKAAKVPVAEDYKIYDKLSFSEWLKVRMLQLK